MNMQSGSVAARARAVNPNLTNFAEGGPVGDIIGFESLIFPDLTFMEQPAKRESFLNGRDIGLLVILALLALGTLLPERRWLAIAQRIARWRADKRGPLDEAELAVIRALVGNRSSDWIEQKYLPEWLSRRYLAWLQLLACCPPRVWRPKAELEGQEHLDAALTRGRGAILWATTFAHNDLFTKAALAESGHLAHLLSRSTHGFSGSRFGRRFLNPVYLRVEQKFMGKNIVIDDIGNAEAIAEVKRRLAQNELVIIYMVPLGRRIATRPFLHGRIDIATGVLNLACETHAAVLPVFTTARADGRVVTALAEALPLTPDAGREAAIEHMIDAYIPKLEAWVETYPDQLAYPLTAADGQMLITASDPSSGSVDVRWDDPEDEPVMSPKSPDPALNSTVTALLDR